MDYLDFNATTPVRPLVAAAMAECLSGPPGNPSSLHRFGREAARRRETAREGVARAAGCSPTSVVFTSGGTEANNLALRGVARSAASRGRHLVTAATEHEAVLHTMRDLERSGFSLTVLPVDGEGRVNPDDVKRALRSETILVSLMGANNETGVLHDLAAIGRVCRERNVLFHSDVVQLFGKSPFSFDDLPLDFASLSAHKIGGPKGVGCLLVRAGVEIPAMVTGGNQERKMRPGTENLPGIVGFGKAAELAAGDLPREEPRLARLRDRFERTLREAIPEAIVNGAQAPRLANTSNVSFPGVDGQDVLVALDLEGIAVSTGAACQAGAAEPSHVILALGRARELAAGSIRFSWGWETTEETIERVLGLLPGLVRRLQSTVHTEGRTSTT